MSFSLVAKSSYLFISACSILYSILTPFSERATSLPPLIQFDIPSHLNIVADILLLINKNNVQRRIANRFCLSIRSAIDTLMTAIECPDFNQQEMILEDD